MPSILNSDDGVVSGTSGLKSTGGNDGLLNIQSNGSTVVAVTGSGISVTGTVSQTGVSTFAAGTVSAPSITFTGDTNTGIFSPAADTIAFTEGGAEAMRIDSSGTVGVGVTPATWTTYKAIQVSSTGAIAAASGGDLVIGNNYYYNSGNKYLTTAAASYYYQYAGAHSWSCAPSGTAGNAATFTQVLAVEKDKSLALQGATSQSGAGITFPATQSASSNANTLDDYEEGDWTPTDASGAGLTLTSTSGKYTKIGRIVFLTATFTYPSTASGSSAQIGGLPFTIADYAGGYSQYTTAAAGAIAFRNTGGLAGGATLLVTNGTNTDTALTNADLSGTINQLFFFGIV